MNAVVDVSKTVLETPRLIIRPWNFSDLDDFYEYAKVDGVGQMAGWTPHKNIDESKEILQMFIDEKKTFALELKSNKKVIGSIGLEQLSLDFGEKYTNLLGREIGYVLSKDYWGKGLMPEAVKRIIEYYLKDEHFDYLQICHAIKNLQSKRVIEKCGFTFVKEAMRKMLDGSIKLARFYVITNKNNN